jgi:predicted kinase
MTTRNVRWVDETAPAGVLEFDAPALLMVAGVPGSGKSTMLSGCDLAGAALLEADAYRGRVQRQHGIDEHAFDQGSIPQARQLFLSDLHDHLAGGRDVIVDAALVRPHGRQELAELAVRYGHQLHMICVDATFEECVAGVNGRARAWEGTVDLLAGYHQAWTDARSQLRDGGWLEPQIQSITVVARAVAPHVQALRFAR